MENEDYDNALYYTREFYKQNKSTHDSLYSILLMNINKLRDDKYYGRNKKK